MASPILVCLSFCLRGRDLGNSSAWRECGRFRVSGGVRFPVSSRRGSSLCFPDRPPRPASSEPASVPALFSRDQIFHPGRNFSVFQQFTAIRLLLANFDLAKEPFVIPDQTLHRFVHQGLTVAPLLRGNPVKLCLQFRRKFNFHSASVGARHASVKTFPSERNSTISPPRFNPKRRRRDRP